MSLETMPAARYSPAAIALHWIVAVLIVGNLAFGLYMTELDLSPAKLKYYSWHKWAGVTILLVAAVRLAWRLGHTPPALPASMPAWERRATQGAHVLLYILFFAAPVSGWLFSSAGGFQTVYFDVLPIPDLLAKSRELADTLKIVHKAITYSLGTLVVLHVLAAVKHHVHDRDDVLTRMLPFLKPLLPRPVAPFPPPSPGTPNR